MWELFSNPIELLASLTGVASVYFSYKKNILTYLFGLISVSLYVFICFKAGIYAEMGINIFYFVMSVYGWFNWHHLFNRNESFIAIRQNFQRNIFFFVMTMIFWIIIFFILKRYTDSNVPLLDSFTTAFFITGMILMNIKSMENWIYLIIGNLVSIPLFIYKELYISSVFYLILTIFACLGIDSWKKTIKIRA